MYHDMFEPQIYSCINCSPQEMRAMKTRVVLCDVNLCIADKAQQEGIL